VLQASEVTRTFGSGKSLAVALSAASMSLWPGQFALVMGPSGSGKSTLLAVLSGLLRPDSGKVLVHGQDLWTLSEAQLREFRRRHFGFIFQGYNLFPELTAREQLEMALRWGEGTPRQEARLRVAEMLELLGLGSRADLLPAQLSGGEKQRVAVGRALLKRPAFCFADEPTSALDWAHGQQVVELLRNATRAFNSTLLVVAHDPRIAEYADRLFQMKDGSLGEAVPVSPAALPKAPLCPSKLTTTQSTLS
jgi:putative ABC transport system ATP-binding protein